MADKKKATVKVTQIGSPIGRRKDQRQTLIGLGLNKMHRTRELEDTPVGARDDRQGQAPGPGRGRGLNPRPGRSE